MLMSEVSPVSGAQRSGCRTQGRFAGDAEGLGAGIAGWVRGGIRAIPSAVNGRRRARVSASMFLDFRQPPDLFLETAAATVTAAAVADPERHMADPDRVPLCG